MAVKTFNRYELKYLINQEQFEVIKAELVKHMILDKNCRETGNYTIYNLYFDTENDDVIRQSVSKPYYKEKLRLRSYSIPVADNDTVYLELKKKIGGVVAKRRATMTYAEALKFVDTGIRPEMENYVDRQVLDEIREFLNRNQVSPKVFISYERTAFFDRNNPKFRVSFDSNIITRRNRVNLTDGDFGSELLDNDVYLMEIKLSTQIPLWLCELLSELKIYRTGFSKYGTEYKQYVEQSTICKAHGKAEHHMNKPVYEFPGHIITA